MQSSTIIVLACLVAAVVASVNNEQYAHGHHVERNIEESLTDAPVHERSARTKRGLLLLKNKPLLGQLGAVGEEVDGAIALKKTHHPKYVEYRDGLVKLSGVSVKPTLVS